MLFKNRFFVEQTECFFHGPDQAGYRGYRTTTPVSFREPKGTINRQPVRTR